MRIIAAPILPGGLHAGGRTPFYLKNLPNSQKRRLRPTLRRTMVVIGA
jgi:hypothetical protein